MSRPVILCVDDEKSILLGLKQEIEQQIGDAYDVELAESGEEALEVVQQILAEDTPLPVLLTDQLMPGMKGDELIVKVKDLSPYTKTILLTGQAAADAVGNALNKGELYRFIAKPWEPQDLRMTVKAAAEAYFRDHELQLRRDELRRLTDNFRTLSAVTLTHELGQTFLTLLIEETSADVGVLFVKDEFGELTPALVLRQEGAFLRAHDEGHDYPVDVVNQAWLTSEPAYEPNLDTTRSCYASLVQRGEQAFAGIYLEWPEAHALNESRAHYLRLMTTGAATYFESAHLYQDLEATVARRSHEIEEQNAELTASIRYARRIQSAFLPELEEIQRVLPNSFLVFEPREEVAGDFYWLHSVGPVHYLGVGDATGIGVPAAFLTMQVSTHLNLLVGERQMQDPAEILQALHARMQASLAEEANQPGATTSAALQEAYSSRVGIDLAKAGVAFALLRIDTKRNVINYAGASSPLLHASGANVKRYSGHRLILGQQKPESDPSRIKTNRINLATGDRIVLFTDGFLDQLGGEQNQPFGEKRLTEQLTELTGQPMEDHRRELHGALVRWQGSRPQTDDRLLLGIGF